MCNYIRMTIRPNTTSGFSVFKLKPSHNYAGAVSGGGARKTTWFVSGAATAMFSGTYAECMDFISAKGAQFMSEHGLPV